MARGGARLGAGRKVNSGVYGEVTIAKRIPVSLVKGIDQFIDSWKDTKEKCNFKLDSTSLVELGLLQVSNLNISLYASRVQAGFPSPADDYIEGSLDLNQHLIRHPAATFFVRAAGNSMIGAGIHNNDILVVDRSLEPKNADIIIAALNGELTVKRLCIAGKEIVLKPENLEYPIINITEEMEFLIWGVVTSVVHQFKDANK